MSKPGYQWNWGMLAVVGFCLVFWGGIAAVVWWGSR